MGSGPDTGEGGSGKRPGVWTAKEGAATKEKGRRVGLSWTKGPGLACPGPPSAAVSSHSGIQAMQSCWDKSQTGKVPSRGRETQGKPSDHHEALAVPLGLSAAASGLMVTPFSTGPHLYRFSRAILPAPYDHTYPQGQGERQGGPFHRNAASPQPGVYFRIWLVPGFASDELLLSV